MGLAGLPLELLNHVLQCLRGDISSLRSALLVNKTWSAEAVRVLWENPPPDDLAAISDINKRQFHARYIRELEINGSEWLHHEIFQTLEFPRLRSVLIDATDMDENDEQEEVWIGQYIQPALEEFTCYATAPAGDEDVLQLLETRCPRLRTMILGAKLQGLSSASLGGFIDRCKSLRSLGVVDGRRGPIDGRVLSSLASHDGLVELEVSPFLRHEMFVNTFQHVDRPFKGIQKLQLNIEPKTVPLLVPKIKNIRLLSLTLADGDISPWPHLRSLTKLRDLTIEYHEPAELSANDFQALKELGLNRLNVRSIYGDIIAPALTDDEFIPVIETQPALREIGLEIRASLTVQSLISLGQVCRKLQDCVLPGTYELSPLMDIDPEPPLFPRLEQLTIDAISEIPPRPW